MFEITKGKVITCLVLVALWSYTQSTKSDASDITTSVGTAILG